MLDDDEDALVTRGPDEYSAMARWRRWYLLLPVFACWAIACAGKVTAQHPLFGVGPGNFVIVSGLWHASHNSHTEMSAEGGIPAFLLYVLFLWRGVANLREVRKYSKTKRGIRLFSIALEVSLAAYLLGSFFLSQAYQLFPYCLVAYTSALLLIVRSDQKVSSRASKSRLTPAQIEVTVWP